MQLTQEIVKELLDYDPETGKLWWKERDVKWFSGDYSERACKAWNTNFSKKEAFTASSDGYKNGSILGKPYRAHQIIFLFVYGFVSEQVDHIDHNRSNNKIINLKDSCQINNGRNQKRNNRNKSGCNGVYKCNATGKWRVQFNFKGKPKHIGRYELLEDAIRARKEIEKENNYHENHGI